MIHIVAIVAIVVLQISNILLLFVIGAQSDCIDKIRFDIKHKDRVIQELKTQNDHLRYYVTRKDNSNKTCIGRQ